MTLPPPPPPPHLIISCIDYFAQKPGILNWCTVFLFGKKKCMPCREAMPGKSHSDNDIQSHKTENFFFKDFFKPLSTDVEIQRGGIPYPSTVTAGEMYSIF